ILAPQLPPDHRQEELVVDSTVRRERHGFLQIGESLFPAPDPVARDPGGLDCQSVTWRQADGFLSQFGDPVEVVGMRARGAEQGPANKEQRSAEPFALLGITRRVRQRRFTNPQRLQILLRRLLPSVEALQSHTKPDVAWGHGGQSRRGAWGLV